MSIMNEIKLLSSQNDLVLSQTEATTSMTWKQKIRWSKFRLMWWFFFWTVYVFFLSFIMMTCFQMVSFHLFNSNTELKVELNRSSATKHLADPSSSASALHWTLLSVGSLLSKAKTFISEKPAENDIQMSYLVTHMCTEEQGHFFFFFKFCFHLCWFLVIT